jgi:hypothetical protein
MQLAGELSKISLPSLIQLVRNGGLTGEISLAQGAKTAAIFVDKGRIVHVESDAGSGREAFLELFLWLAGTFSFTECKLGDIPRTIPADESMDRLLRDGVAYLEQKKYLDQLRINGQTVLKPTAPARQGQAVPLLDRIDGRKTLAEALADARMSRREYVQAVYRLLSDGLAVVAEPEPGEEGDRVNLPGWVVARLKQDNPDLSQAIISMVIWVDRVKCWMYQADADLAGIIDQLGPTSPAVTEPLPERQEAAGQRPPELPAPQVQPEIRPVGPPAVPQPGPVPRLGQSETPPPARPAVRMPRAEESAGGGPAGMRAPLRSSAGRAQPGGQPLDAQAGDGSAVPGRQDTRPGAGETRVQRQESGAQPAAQASEPPAASDRLSRLREARASRPSPVEQAGQEKVDGAATDENQSGETEEQKPARVDWPKTSIPKKSAVDRYPTRPAPPPSIEF